MRWISRVCDVSINTVSKLLVDAGNFCADLHDREVWNVKATKVQCDKIWSFTAARQTSPTRRRRSRARARATNRPGPLWIATANSSFRGSPAVAMANMRWPSPNDEGQHTEDRRHYVPLREGYAGAHGGC